MTSAADIQPERLPSVLVSFAYRRSWEKRSSQVAWREVVLDSGAFTVHHAGGTVDLVEFAEWALEQRATNPLVTEVFTLDVIGDWRASLKNTEELVKRGLPVIPVYHVGEPTDVLKALARDYDKIALGGAVGYHHKMEWAALCFREVWPKKIHGLGFGSKSVFKLPFHTVDHSALVEVFRSARYGSLGHLPIYGSRHKHSVAVEVQHLLDTEARARRFWSGRLPPELGDVPSVRLAASSASTIHYDAMADAAARAPSIRIAMSGNGMTSEVRTLAEHVTASQHSAKEKP